MDCCYIWKLTISRSKENRETNGRLTCSSAVWWPWTWSCPRCCQVPWAHKRCRCRYQRPRTLGSGSRQGRRCWPAAQTHGASRSHTPETCLSPSVPCRDPSRDVSPRDGRYSTPRPSALKQMQRSRLDREVVNGTDVRRMRAMLHPTDNGFITTWKDSSVYSTDNKFMTSNTQRIANRGAGCHVQNTYYWN